jgi:hypothetical protein
MQGWAYEQHVTLDRLPPASVKIMERRLKVGVHNSLTFTCAPVVAHLSADPTDTAVLRFDGILELRDLQAHDRTALTFQVRRRVHAFLKHNCLG